MQTNNCQTELLSLSPPGIFWHLWLHETHSFKCVQINYIDTRTLMSGTKQKWYMFGCACFVMLNRLLNNSCRSTGSWSYWRRNCRVTVQSQWIHQSFCLFQVLDYGDWIFLSLFLLAALNNRSQVKWRIKYKLLQVKNRCEWQMNVKISVMLYSQMFVEELVNIWRGFTTEQLRLELMLTLFKFYCGWCQEFCWKENV